MQERQEENARLWENACLERDSYVCTNTGVTQRQLEQVGHPTQVATGFLFSSLLPQSRFRLNEFYRPSSEFWLFLFSLSTFPTKPFTKVTRIVIDWILWFSVLLPFRMSSEVLRIKLLRNKKPRAMCLTVMFL